MRQRSCPSSVGHCFRRSCSSLTLQPSGPELLRGLMEESTLRSKSGVRGGRSSLGGLPLSRNEARSGWGELGRESGS
eukprot:4925993-Amphidinium_carterae.1